MLPGRYTFYLYLISSYFTKFLYFIHLFIYLSILYIINWSVCNFNFM